MKTIVFLVSVFCSGILFGDEELFYRLSRLEERHVQFQETLDRHNKIYNKYSPVVKDKGLFFQALGDFLDEIYIEYSIRNLSFAGISSDNQYGLAKTEHERANRLYSEIRELISDAKFLLLTNKRDKGLIAFEKARDLMFSCILSVESSENNLSTSLFHLYFAFLELEEFWTTKRKRLKNPEIFTCPFGF